jgi:predicted nucleic acid-binding Zn ribbon protein
MSRSRRSRRPDADSGPRPLGEMLDAAVTRLGPAGLPPTAAASMSAVFSRWEEIAGPALALHARPLRLQGAVLVVAVDNPAWATQVRALGADLLARVGEVSGRTPERLEVTVRRPTKGP